MPLTALAAVFTACFLWAVSFIATKVALDSVPPMNVVFLRLAVSALCFALWLGLRRTPGLQRTVRDRFWAFLGLSLMGAGLHYGSQTLGLQWTTASNASLYAVTGPITIAILGAVFLKERLTPLRITGIVVAVAGVLVVMGGDTLAGVEIGAHVWGDLLVLASIVMWGVFTVFGKRITDELGAVVVTAVVTVLGAATLAPVAAVEAVLRGFRPDTVNAAGWTAIAFLGVGCSFLATLLYFVALQRSEAQKVGVFLYTIPPMTALIAGLTLGETLGLGFFVGSALVFAGVFLTDRA